MNQIRHYRGWSIIWHEWVYGWYVYNGEESLIYPLSNGLSQVVDPESVGQSTGLKDCNGKEIYEGDIIKNELFVYLVQWRNDFAVWYAKCKYIGRETDYESGNLGLKIHNYKSQVIGNQFENPELLEDNNDNQ